jgi:hypothetical protein
MIRLAPFLVLAALAPQALLAQARCPSPREQSVFELQALKSELTVLALSCGLREPYNAFVRRYRPELGANEQAFTAYFRQTGGSRGQTAQDTYITRLANAHSQAALGLGEDFCPRNGMMFKEVMALEGGADLAPYAAGKRSVPDDVGACTSGNAPVVQPAAARAHAPARHERPAAKTQKAATSGKSTGKASAKPARRPATRR